MKNCFVVAEYTFKEIMKSKILILSLLLGIMILLVTYVATEFTYGVPQKVGLDFGLGMLSISSMAISIFVGATLLPREIDSRTVYMAISRPVPRWAFISGKLLGLLTVSMVNFLFLSLVTLIVVALMNGEITQSLFVAIAFTFLESLLLLLVVVCASLLMNPFLSGSVGALLLMLGHAVKESQTLTFAKHRPSLMLVLKFYHAVLPGFYKLNFKEFVIYQESIDTNYILGSLGYGLSYSMFLLFMIIFLFNKKSLD